MRHMMQARSYKAVGIALLGFGALILALGLSGGQPALRVAGPVLGFLGIVMLAQAKRRS
jgi:hypothetical protein